MQQNMTKHPHVPTQNLKKIEGMKIRLQLHLNTQKK